MTFEIKLNTPCKIWSNYSMKNPSGTIIKETKLFVYWQEVYDSYQHAPSQRQQLSGRLRKSEISLITYNKQ